MQVLKRKGEKKKIKIVQQKNKLDVENHDVKKRIDKKHGPLLPSTIRCIIAGPSNCGKTNVMISLIEHENGLKFENVYVYSRSLFQPKYEYLEKLLKPISGVGYQAYGASENIVETSDAKPNSLFIFDDVSCVNQNVIREYFSSGRHSGVDSFYLCQSYAKIPKHLIRDNVNMLVLFKQDDLNLNHVYKDHVNTDMKFETLKKCARNAGKNRMDFCQFSKMMKSTTVDTGKVLINTYLPRKINGYRPV